MTAPSPVSVATVKAFLRRSGVGNVRATRFGEFIVASAPIVVWEAMFEVASSARAAPFPDPTPRVHLPALLPHAQTVFYAVTPKRSRRDGGPATAVYRAHRIVLPESLRDHVVAALNTVQTPVVSELTPAASVISGGPIPAAAIAKMFAPRPDKAVVPSSSGLGEPFPPLDGFTYPKLLDEQYNIDRSRRSSRKATQAVFESANQLMSEADLTLFQAAFALPSERVAKNVGGHIVSDACPGVQSCAEANLGQWQCMIGAQAPPTILSWSSVSSLF
jgi:hypothetical protein